MADRGLTIERMVKLAQVSRASYYRFEESARSGWEPDMELRDAIQRIALEWPSYGRRRITQELRRRGWRVSPKRVQRLMRKDNLLCVRKRKFVVIRLLSDPENIDLLCRAGATVKMIRFLMAVQAFPPSLTTSEGAMSLPGGCAGHNFLGCQFLGDFGGVRVLPPPAVF